MPPTGAQASTLRKMLQKIVWSLSLFLVLTITSRDVNIVVDAFATRSTTRSTTLYSPGRIIMRSSSKASASAVEEKVSSTEVVVTSTESSSTESKTSNESLESTHAVISNGDANDDASINSMTNKAATKEKGEDDESDGDNLMEKIKESGVAGIISYAAWELAFWTVSVPVCVLGYKEVTGHWPDLNDKDDISKLGAEAFAFVNFARFAVPLRIGLALGTIPWIQKNIVDVFLVDEESNDDKDEEIVAKEGGESSGENDDDSDETVVAQSTKDSHDEVNIKSEGILSRFRIRSRLGNLINRVLRRKNQSQPEDEE